MGNKTSAIFLATAIILLCGCVDNFSEEKNKAIELAKTNDGFKNFLEKNPFAEIISLKIEKETTGVFKEPEILEKMEKTCDRNFNERAYWLVKAKQSENEFSLLINIKVDAIECIISPNFNCSGRPPTRQCAVAHGKGLQQANCFNGAWIFSETMTCILSECDAGYSLDATKKTCLASACNENEKDTADCNVQFGKGNKTRSCTNGKWGAWSDCMATACNIGYALSSNKCVFIGCTTDAECSDDNPCTKDTCDVIMKECISAALPNCSITGCAGESVEVCNVWHGIGEKIRTCNNGTWSAWGDCTNVTCDYNYLWNEIRKECTSVPCIEGITYSLMCSVPNGVGNKTIECRNGQYIETGECKAYYCNDGYDLDVVANTCLNAGACVENSKQGKNCTALILYSSSAERSRTCTGGQWGAWGQCMLISCISPYVKSYNECVTRPRGYTDGDTIGNILGKDGKMYYLNVGPGTASGLQNKIKLELYSDANIKIDAGYFGQGPVVFYSGGQTVLLTEIGISNVARIVDSQSDKFFAEIVLHQPQWTPIIIGAGKLMYKDYAYDHEVPLYLSPGSLSDGGGVSFILDGKTFWLKVNLSSILIDGNTFDGNITIKENGPAGPLVWSGGYLDKQLQRRIVFVCANYTPIKYALLVDERSAGTIANIWLFLEQQELGAFNNEYIAFGSTDRQEYGYSTVTYYEPNIVDLPASYGGGPNYNVNNHKVATIVVNENDSFTGTVWAYIDTRAGYLLYFPNATIDNYTFEAKYSWTESSTRNTSPLSANPYQTYPSQLYTKKGNFVSIQKSGLNNYMHIDTHQVG